MQSMGSQPEVRKPSRNRVKIMIRGNRAVGEVLSFSHWTVFFCCFCSMPLWGGICPQQSGWLSPCVFRDSVCARCCWASYPLTWHKPGPLERAVAGLNQEKSRQDRAVNEPGSQASSCKEIFTVLLKIHYTQSCREVVAFTCRRSLCQENLNVLCTGAKNPHRTVGHGRK